MDWNLKYSGKIKIVMFFHGFLNDIINNYCSYLFIIFIITCIIYEYRYKYDIVLLKSHNNYREHKQRTFVKLLKFKLVYSHIIFIFRIYLNRLIELKLRIKNNILVIICLENELLYYYV